MGLKDAEVAVERLWAFLWENYPSERANLEPIAASRAAATVNVVMKLLVARHGVGGLPIRYTTSGKKRHLEHPTEKNKTLCGFEAFTLAQLIETGNIAVRDARKLKDTGLCGKCRLAYSLLNPVTQKEMASTAERLRELEKLLASAE